MKQVSICLSLKELLMLRHAMAIGTEDGSLIGDLTNGDPDPEDVERAERINQKIQAAIGKIERSSHDG